MKKQSVEEIIMNGINGSPDIKIDEKNKYLGTYRERIEKILTVSQVFVSTIYPEIKQIMEQNKNIQLLLNGDIRYEFLSKYIQLANQLNITFAIVQNNDSQTSIGLVLAHPHAVDKENININER